MNWYKIAQKLEDVELKGKLKQTKNGFTYLDINDDIVDGLFSLIDEDGIKKPPYNQKKYNSIGTHISIIKDSEVEENDLEIKEVGKEYNFTLGEFKSTDPEGWDGVEEVYFIQVHSPELEELRKKYGLSKKIDGHEFHITIAIEEE